MLTPCARRLPLLTPEEQAELQRLRHEHIPIRAIARRLGRDVKTIRRALGRPSRPPEPPKLAPYHALIREWGARGLRSPRILRELRARGYTGGATILKGFLQTLGPRRPPRPVVRRFETAPGLEAQSDWRPYRVTIADRETVVHAFSLVLGYSRRLFVAVFRDEWLPTLLWAHQAAFEYDQGLCRRICYDNQTAITLGRVRGRPRWHPTFLAVAHHYGFEPVVGRPGHKERRGKVERPFWYLEEDFLRARTFASWDDLRVQVRHWLDTIANVRVHGTTRRRVDAAYAEERPCLIALPAIPYPAAREETRVVQQDGAVPIDGSYYPAPGQRPGPVVTVRIDPAQVELLDPGGVVVATYAVSDVPTRLPSATPPPGPPTAAIARPVAEARFPDAGAVLDGLKHRMTALTPIHLRALERLAMLYGDAALGEALAVATTARNFNARAIERILERAHPTVVPEPIAPAGRPRPEALAALDDVDPGSPGDYTLDALAPTEGPTHDAWRRRPRSRRAGPDPPRPAAPHHGGAPPRRAPHPRGNDTAGVLGLPPPPPRDRGRRPLGAQAPAPPPVEPARPARHPPRLRLGRPPAALPAGGQGALDVPLHRRTPERAPGGPALHREDHGGQGHRPCRVRSGPERVLRAHGRRAPGPARAARADGTYRKVFRRVAESALVILDDAGFTELGREAANELFRIVSARTATRSMIVVTNLPFKQGGESLPSPAQAVAIADRLVDNATILRFTGKPYRQPRDIHGAPLEDE